MIEEKKKLRKHIKEIKSKLSEHERLAQSELIFSSLYEQPYFKKANTILTYWSMDDEVYTHKFIQDWHKQKQLLLPSVNGNDLEIKRFEGMESMVPGEQFGILEPNGAIFNKLHKIDLIIVPGVAFDENKQRMGRGRGYYDKLLCLSKAVKVGICFDFQFFDTIPSEEHDIPMDHVIHS